MIIYIIIAFIIIFIIEAFHDLQVIKNDQLLRYFIRNKDKRLKDEVLRNTRSWHKIDFVSWLLIAITVSLTAYPDLFHRALIVVIIGLLRILVFNIILNKLRGLRTLYLSSDGFESNFKGNEIYYYLVVLALLIFSLVIF